LLAAADVREIVEQVLLLKGRVWPARAVLLEVPEARRIRGHHLIDQDDVTLVNAEFELRVSEDQPTLEGARNAELIEDEACLLEGLRELLTGPPGQFGTRDVFVMPS